MRFILYNIRYATGTSWSFHLPVPFSGYFRDTRRNLEAITAFLKAYQADVIGLVEVDSGSFRSGRLNQAQLIAEELGHAHVYESKYAQRSLVKTMPVACKQGNAFITGLDIRDRGFHYFHNGVKKLVIELELDLCVIFLVHLSLKYRHRQNQLNQLYSLFRQVDKPVIVAGDFNAFWGDSELELFLAATGLQNANRDRVPTYPSIAPRRELDFILHSPSIHVTHFEVPALQLSDHMPLVCDFEIN